MAIYDCFQFFDEEYILDLRLNILDEFVNFFVIAESTTNHQGNLKNLNFDLNKFKKFQNKIIYIVVDDTTKAIKKHHLGGESLVEQHQRNSIMRGLKNCLDSDLVILSDLRISFISLGLTPEPSPFPLGFGFGLNTPLGFFTWLIIFLAPLTRVPILYPALPPFL